MNGNLQQPSYVKSVGQIPAALADICRGCFVSLQKDLGSGQPQLCSRAVIICMLHKLFKAWL